MAHITYQFGSNTNHCTLLPHAFSTAASEDKQGVTHAMTVANFRRHADDGSMDLDGASLDPPYYMINLFCPVVFLFLPVLAVSLILERESACL